MGRGERQCSSHWCMGKAVWHSGGGLTEGAFYLVYLFTDGSGGTSNYVHDREYLINCKSNKTVIKIVQ